MCSSYPVHGYKAWQWRPYSGANPHKHHAHIEVQEIPKLYDDARDWSIGSAPVHHASFEANSEKTAETANSPQSGADHTDEIYHVVSIGDTLTKIANTHSTTVDALKAINGLSGDLIRLGQRLRVK